MGDGHWNRSEGSQGCRGTGIFHQRYCHSPVQNFLIKQEEAFQPYKLMFGALVGTMAGEVRAIHSVPGEEGPPTHCKTLGQGPSPVHFEIKGESQQGGETF